jgi:cytochrome c-type protein NapC
MDSLSPLAIFALTCAGCATLTLVLYLIRRPPLTAASKLWLLVGLGVFPIGAAASGNIAGFERTKERTFCTSCHVMTPHGDDAQDPASGSLAARHSRNKLFGDESCYTCHADYGMFGTLTTKMGGMRHVWLYYTEFKDMPIDEAKRTIHIRKPYPNNNCMQCHSTTDTLFLKTKDHASSLEDIRSGIVSCASAGCHGYAHPFTKDEDGEKKAASDAPKPEEHR